VGHRVRPAVRHLPPRAGRVSLLVSIHDVTPALEAGVLSLWEMCAARGVSPALLVVPDWHGEWPLDRHAGFTRWLCERARAGAEIILHGEHHTRGEFRGLGRAAARERIERGLSALRRLGLEPAGFVPPAWRAREEGHAAVREAGLAFSEDERSIRLFPEGRLVPSPAVRWSGRTPARAWGSVAVARVRWLLQRGARYPRLALHPQDYAHSRTTRDLPATLDRWLTRHPPIGYTALRESELPAAGGSTRARSR
jgi:predicted deacetylase